MEGFLRHRGGGQRHPVLHAGVLCSGSGPAAGTRSEFCSTYISADCRKLAVPGEVTPLLSSVLLQTLKVITGASKHDIRRVGSSLPLSESGTQMMLEIFASIGSATLEGLKGLLGTIPTAVDLMLKTEG